MNSKTSNQNGNFQEPSGDRGLQNDQPRLRKIKTRTTIVEQREDEDLLYEQIKDSRFKQQRLPAWRPVPTIMSIIIVFSVFGLIFIILGIVILVYSNKVKSVVIRYDEICGKTIGNTCTVEQTLEEKIEKPVFFYYQLDGFFQNSRRYVKSKNIDQLRGLEDIIEDCEPAQTNQEMGFTDLKRSIDNTPLDPTDHAIPCGLVAKTFFNDKFSMTINQESVEIDEKDISFEKDRDIFKKNLDTSRQWQDLTDEHFLVWMRPSGLPNPRKLWGKINRDLNKGDKLVISIENKYNVSAYNGTKKIVLSNATAFGGKNKFLGISYIVVGGLSLICAIIFPVGYKYQLSKEKDS
jgi:hypothetical protein